MSDQAIQLMQGDCLALMPLIPAGSVDCICTDLPYGTTACAWDTVIPFALMWEAYKRIVKPNGAIVLFGSEPFSSHLRLSNIKEYKYDLVWDKLVGHSPGIAKYRPLPSHEIVSVFSPAKGKTTYNPQMRQGFTAWKRKDLPKEQREGNPNEHKFGYQKACVRQGGDERFPMSVIAFTAVRELGQHPTQKPVALLEYLIRTYTNEGETVLDSCMGSASTAIACMRTGRKFIGIEKDEAYFQICLDRVKAEQRQGRLFTV